LTFLLETMKLGLTNIRLHALRSVLTALGIILGVTAVITMVSIGEGSKQAALAQLELLGAKNIIARSVKPPESTQGSNSSSGGRRSWLAKYGLTRRDIEVIRANFPHADAIVPLKDVGSQILRSTYRDQSQSFGTTPDFQRVANLKMAHGRYLTSSDMEEQSSVAVIGQHVAKTLFPNEDPLGETFRIDDKAFTVIGILAPVGLSGGAGAALVGRDLNRDVHIPLTTAKTRFGDTVIRRQSGAGTFEEVQAREVFVASPSREQVLTDASMLKRLMDARPGGSRDIQLIIPYELLENAKRSALTWQIVLASIAAISLLVGGIGIMNIMLASVTERTREIGIRRALGATQRHIIWQFLVETGVLSAVGGMIGVTLGVTASLALGLGAEKIFPDVMVRTQLTGWSIILSFSVATITGLVFGIYPAMKAAKQDPIVALRHD
jgi:putative ABC transport system permease protein